MIYDVKVLLGQMPQGERTPAQVARDHTRAWPRTRPDGGPAAIRAHAFAAPARRAGRRPADTQADALPSSFFWILPIALRGSVSTTRTSRGRLCTDRRSATKSITASGEMPSPTR